MITAAIHAGEPAWLTVMLQGKRFVYRVTVLGKSRDAYRVRLDEPVARLDGRVLREGECGRFPRAALSPRSFGCGR